MMKATSPAAKSSPMHTEAIRARDTSTSALMSKAVTRPMTASRMMGTPQRMMATHAGSKGRGSTSKMLTSSGDAGEHQQGDVLFDAAQLQKALPAFP